MKREGGNGIVRFNGDLATKTLKNSSRSGLERFAVEVKALRLAQEAGVPNIVELVDTKLDEDPPNFTMRRCAGDIDALLKITRNNPIAITQLMLPVIKSLQQLATLPMPIFHRDIKPSNILYKGTLDKPALVIADFGCAFLAHPHEKRMTQPHRAVGAMLFRSPEYSYGRVENVNSSGDIFSIGKLLWYMCNGARNEVFPYTLWFPREYNLTERCDAAGVNLLNLIISSCVAYHSTNRINYEDLILALENLLENPVLDANEAERLRIQTYEAEFQVKQSEIMSNFVNLVENLHSDLNLIANEISKNLGGTTLGSSILDMTKFRDTAEKVAEVVVRDSIDHPIADWHTTHSRVHIRARPSNQCQIPDLLEKATPFIGIQFSNTMDSSLETVVIYHAQGRGVMVHNSNDGSRPYSRGKLMKHFENAISRIGR